MKLMPRLLELGKRVSLFIGLAVLILLVMDFNNRMAELTRLSAQKEREVEELDALLATQAQLEAEIAYATSEPAVEEWAREQGRWIKDGDVPIVPLAGEEVEAEAAPLAEAPQQALSFWQAWLAWFFGTAP